MALISMHEVHIRFGGEALLDGVTLHLERNERACLVGRNGSGKSTLLKLLAGTVHPDAGTIRTTPGLRIAHLPQEVPEDLAGPVQALVERSDATRAADPNPWQRAQAAQQAMTQLGLQPSAHFETLSGGMKRRVLLARALAGEPDLLLLDEPTNHLDIEAIEWLEPFLLRAGRTLLFVTHDRTFLRRLATRILDLDRGQLVGWNCDYDTFLRRKQQRLDDEAAQWEKRGQRLTQEEIWIRKGIKARRTRNEGRLRALQALRETFRQRRLTDGVSRLRLHAAGKSGTRVAKARNVGFAYPGEPPLIRNLDLNILRGERIGIIGPNGIGKTTLLKLLTGALKPTSGTLTLGTRLEIAYFDQMRYRLDGQKTLAENVAGDAEFVDPGGQRRHVYGYLQDFLFTPERARTPVKVLSGGERNRLMLAMLFLRPSNLLIMDEPTNDLDIETLDLLEEQLQQHAQTLLLVSHDRAFLNNVITRTLVFEGNGIVQSYAGGYDDWVAQRPAPVRERRSKPAPSRARKNNDTPRGLTFSERIELDGIPARIESFEAEQARLIATQCEPAFYKNPPPEIARIQKRAAEVALHIDRLLERWAGLDAIAAAEPDPDTPKRPG